MSISISGSVGAGHKAKVTTTREGAEGAPEVTEHGTGEAATFSIGLSDGDSVAIECFPAEDEAEADEGAEADAPEGDEDEAAAAAQ